MKASLAILCVCATLSAWGSDARTTRIEGIDLPKHRQELELHGAGVLRKGFFFKVYLGALYLENSGHARRVMEHVPKRIDIHYFHYTPKRYMVNAALDALRQNLGDDAFQRLKPGIDRLHDAYRDGTKGACASILYRPGEGLTYLYNDEPVLTIDNDDFANAYFNIWLGEQPSSRSVKTAMLRTSGE